MKYQIINKKSANFGEVGTLLSVNKHGVYFLKLESGTSAFFFSDLKPLENIYLTPEEVSERSKKFAKMEQRILDWIEHEKDLAILHRLENLLK